MDPSVFFSALIGAILRIVPMDAGVVCDRNGFCVEQPQFRNALPVPGYPPQVYPPQVYPPQVYPPPPVQAPRQEQDALGAKVKREIYDLCTRHPEEQMCKDLEAYLQQHPDAR